MMKGSHHPTPPPTRPSDYPNGSAIRQVSTRRLTAGSPPSSLQPIANLAARQLAYPKAIPLMITRQPGRVCLAERDAHDRSAAPERGGTAEKTGPALSSSALGPQPPLIDAKTVFDFRRG